MTPMVMCLIIFALMIIGFISGKISMPTCMLSAVVLLTVTGCMKPNDALAYFGNANVIMIAGMSVVAAGFNRTSFCTNLANAISKMAKGSLTKMLAGYMMISMILSQLIQSPVVVLGIVGPMIIASAESMGIKSSKVMFSTLLVCVGTCCVLPIGAGATVPAELNGYLESYGYTDYAVGFFDPVIARLPMLIVMVLYGIFIAPKFAPDDYLVAPGTAVSKKAQEPLGKFQEISAIVIFFADAIALMFAKQLGLANWQICMIGALLMVWLKVLKPREAINSLPVAMLLMIAAGLCMSGALSSTGAGAAIGGVVAKVVDACGGNSYLVGAIFFIVPFIMTQVMQNRGVMLLFIPIAIATCATAGLNPVGLIILVQAGSLTAFMTPMATPAVPYAMDWGGYTQASMFKQSWLIALISWVVSVGWIMTIQPL